MHESDQRLLARALERALEWHGIQKRKGTEIPYASHLLQVAGLVLDHGGDATQAAAALLHDSVEDCEGVDAAVVRAEFGPRIAAIVEACTDTLPGETAEKKAPWAERKRAYLDHLREASPDAVLVSACDKRHNLGAIVADLREHGPGTLARFRPDAAQIHWYYAGILRAAGGRIPARLRDELRALLREFDVLADVPGRCTEREITAPVDECRPDGRLAPEAVGWSRRPLHRCNLRGAPGRKKRWDYWCVTSGSHLLSITYTDLDYAGLASAWVLEYEPLRLVEKSVIVPFARGFAQPATVGGGPIRFDRDGLRIDVTEASDGTRLQVAFDTPRGPVDADVFVALPPGHETLSVVVPWSERRFQYTSKHNTRPAAGRVRIGADELRFGRENGAFGTLDYGRGVWPWRSAWNWGSGSGVVDGRTIGLNLGGKWTDGTGSTENGLCLDGRLHKLSEDLVWEYDRRNWMAPWRVRTPRSRRVDLRFEPFFEKANRMNLGLLATDLHVCFGRWHGTVVDDDGESVAVRDVVGWAEEHRARW